MRLSFTLTFRDLLLFNLGHQLRSVPLHLLCLFVASFPFLFPQEGDTLAYKIAAVPVTYLACWMVQLLFTGFYLAFPQKRTDLTDHAVEIQEGGFFDETRFCKVCYYWPGIGKVANRMGYVAVYVSGNAAHIIPGRAFTDASHRAQFLAALSHFARH